MQKKLISNIGLTGNSGIISPNFHVAMSYDSNKKVFVNWKFRHKKDNGKIEEYLGWKRMTLARALKEKRTIIKCCHCKNPAIRLDHYYPYMLDMNACADHLKKS